MIARSVVALAVAGAGVAAQGPPGALRGEVVSAATGERLGYSIVVLQPFGAQRFTTDSGAFAFEGVRVGSYHLFVRQLGYLPLDTLVAVGDGPVFLRIALRSVAFELPPVTVVARGTCTAPGPPDPRAAPDLALIFAELRENAARYQLLADAYPVRYWMERTFSDADGRDSVRLTGVDTVVHETNLRRHYAPGRLLHDVPGRRGGVERLLDVPTLADLADSAFHKAHCFWFGGVDTIAGQTRLRVDFLAAARLAAPDVDGTAFLDAATHQLSHMTLTLTRPERAARGMKALEVSVTFREVLSAVPVPAEIAAVTTLSGASRLGRRVVRLHESQRLVRMQFLKQVPSTP